MPIVYNYNFTLDDVIKLNNEGKTREEIAKILNTSMLYLKRYFKDNSLIPNYSGGRLVYSFIKDDKAICTKCGAWKPLSSFDIVKSHTRRDRKKYPEGRRRAICHECFRAKVLKRRNRSIEANMHERISRLRRRATKEGIPLGDLTVEYFKYLWSKQNGKCFYFGEELDYRMGNTRANSSFSIDKIIPELGYIVGNIVFCSKKANIVKNNLSLPELK